MLKFFDTRMHFRFVILWFICLCMVGVVSVAISFFQTKGMALAFAYFFKTVLYASIISGFLFGAAGVVAYVLLINDRGVPERSPGRLVDRSFLLLLDDKDLSVVGKRWRSVLFLSIVMELIAIFLVAALLFLSEKSQFLDFFGPIVRP